MVKQRPTYSYATVELSRFYLVQIGLFDGEKYHLPKVVEGQYAKVAIDDVDNWKASLNRMEGRVTRYDFFTRLHTIEIEKRGGIAECVFFAHEIVKL